jgi:ADP-ribosyl-[dinitrogen reductase] hydrolase
VNNSGWAVSTLDAALWAFNTTESFADGLIAAVNLGGDSDSIGAVYGQLAGAFYGFDAIPDRWVKAVKTWEKVDALIERFLDALEM